VDNTEVDEYLIPEVQPTVLRQIPLLYCLFNSFSLALRSSSHLARPFFSHPSTPLFRHMGWSTLVSVP